MGEGCPQNGLFWASQKLPQGAGHLWLRPIILAIQEAEIRRIEVQSQPGQIVWETLVQKTLSRENPS
jgi:hypothetical protein